MSAGCTRAWMQEVIFPYSRTLGTATCRRQALRRTCSWSTYLALTTTNCLPRARCCRWCHCYRCRRCPFVHYDTMFSETRRRRGRKHGSGRRPSRGKGTGIAFGRIRSARHNATRRRWPHVRPVSSAPHFFLLQGGITVNEGRIACRSCEG